ncbi:MAG: hypothetical protein AAB922_03705 [Patescibacteria group bacterium]
MLDGTKDSAKQDLLSITKDLHIAVHRLDIALHGERPETVNPPPNNPHQNRFEEIYEIVSDCINKISAISDELKNI